VHEGQFQVNATMGIVMELHLLNRKKIRSKVGAVPFASSPESPDEELDGMCDVSSKSQISVSEIGERCSFTPCSPELGKWLYLDPEDPPWRRSGPPFHRLIRWMLVQAFT
jgi:hypothetical protein